MLFVVTRSSCRYSGPARDPYGDTETTQSGRRCAGARRCCRGRSMPPAGPPGLPKLTASSHTVADMAQALAQERVDGPERELRVWADAVRSCVESHLRDMELWLPWVRFSRKDLAAMFDRPSGGRCRSGRPSRRSFIPFPRWRPPLNVSRPRSVRSTDCEKTLSVNPSQNRANLARITLLADAIQQSVADAAALIRRLTVDHADSGADSSRHGFHVPLRSDA